MKHYLFAAAILLASCDKNENGPCTEGETACDGNIFKVCEGGFFRQELCTDSCNPVSGCSDQECDPNLGTTCVGENVHVCEADGNIGDFVETCPDRCQLGDCISTSNNCATGTELIYLVDSGNHLFSFDPIAFNAGQNAFVDIGELNCPAGSPLGGFPSPASPFSMSVDRQGTAWVLYTSGQLFEVDTTNASCQATTFVNGQQDFELFGMGFVSDASGADTETLYIAGGPVDRFTIGDLGTLNTSTLQVSRIGALPNDPANSPELTGTGEGNLFAYYPGDAFTQSQVAQVNKTSANHITTNRFDPTANGALAAWAFAHFGGDFYLFTTTDNGFGNTNSQIVLFEQDTQSVEVLLNNLPFLFVGAGVSTCAPVILD
jgi:hypothetical protein